MFLWVGCELPQEFSGELRSRCLGLNEDIGLNTDAFSLPQHVSLKISFPVAQEQAEAVRAFLKAMLEGEAPIRIRFGKPELQGNVLWLPVKDEPRLESLHRRLDEQLEQRFAVAQHEFDKCFRFHSTLFMDDDGQKLESMYGRLKDWQPEEEVRIDGFLLGSSPDGTPGSYRIDGRIPAQGH